ncbi:TetR/AcrR family transcriptional regulator [Candidatus Enterococcus willemsii]|uniref:TetR family transcriptional regulator n=1 Tax=Candidatus Enterococcus willemsii TaxID=1857215 RepID=A0ABQ6Z1L3_9ENTE|nr:TetR/AcrR family transcriptional regulator [Enterococcus sp. CU12B]KAF1305156.1 TetR family transcriptional regulator [Enterococcus sp. CU12B]
MNGFEKRTYDKKQQILRSAFDLMNTEHGVKNMKLDILAKEANVGKTTLFKYFGSKEGIIHEVFKQYINQLIMEAEQIIQQQLSFEETLLALSKNKISFIEKIHHQFYLDLMAYMTTKKGSGISLLMQKYILESKNMMLDLFYRGRKEGKVDLKYSDEFLLVYFQAIVEGISNPSVYDRVAPYTEQWTEMLLKGLAPAK